MENTENTYKYLDSVFKRINFETLPPTNDLHMFWKDYKTENHTLYSNIGQNSKTTQVVTKGIDVFEYYLLYLEKNKKVVNKDDRIKLFEELFYNLHITKEEEEDINLNSSAFLETLNTPNRFNDILEKPTVKAKKTIDLSITPDKIPIARIIQVFSDCIKKKLFILEASEQEEDSNEQQALKQGLTELMQKAIEKEGRSIKKYKDSDFQRKGQNLSIWVDTETKCQKLIEHNEEFKKMVKRSIVINLNDVEYGNPRNIKVTTLTWVVEKTLQCKKVEDYINPVWSALNKPTIHIENITPLEKTTALKKAQVKCIYVCSGHNLLAGGGSDMGFTTNETSLMLSSTYYLAISEHNDLYPLPHNTVIAIPNVLVFKNPVYPHNTIVSNESVKISVICATPIYNSKNNVTDKLTEFNDRLLLPHATFENEDKFYNYCVSFLKCASMYNFDTVIVDDLGYKEYFLPLHGCIKIFLKAVKNCPWFRNIYWCSTDEVFIQTVKKYM
jgi:hypothetical protein